jgi:hypothetical protein
MEFEKSISEESWVRIYHYLQGFVRIELFTARMKFLAGGLLRQFFIWLNLELGEDFYPRNIGLGTMFIYILRLGRTREFGIKCCIFFKTIRIWNISW